MLQECYIFNSKYNICQSYHITQMDAINLNLSQIIMKNEMNNFCIHCFFFI